MRISKYLSLALSAALLVGCEKSSEIKVYRVSKAPLEQSGPQQQDAMPTNSAAPRMPGGLAPTAQTSVTTPPNWEAQPLSQMRQASFLVKGDNGAVADVSFVSLGSAAGNVLENVNRWLGQLGQSPIRYAARWRSDCALRYAMSPLLISQDFPTTPIQRETAESLPQW